MRARGPCQRRCVNTNRNIGRERLTERGDVQHGFRERVHVDASLIRADISWESLAKRHVEAVARAKDGDEEVQNKAGRPDAIRRSASPTPMRRWRRM